MSDSRDDEKKLLDEFDRQLSGGRLAIPDDIADWLGHLMLLYGAPFNYLVPDETMLPMESVRFFSLDPGWLKCLLEGACSVGRQSVLDQNLDQHLRNHFLDLAGRQAVKLRDGETGELHWPLTGFLLRSLIVEGWQGLEMTAKGKDGQGNTVDPLQTLRMDRLGPDVMLCIFNGKVTDIEIRQPPEGLHFGASLDPGGPNRYRKLSLRRLHPEARAGDQLEGDHPVQVPMRAGVERVIEIKALAEQMGAELTQAGALDGAFTSAEFGVQMVESPGRAVFKAKFK